jgi:hypothetical protein
MKKRIRTRLAAMLTALVAVTLIASAGPAMAAIINDGAAGPTPMTFTPKLAAEIEPVEVAPLAVTVPEKAAAPVVEAAAPEKAEAAEPEAAPKVATSVGDKIAVEPVDTSALEDSTYRTEAATVAERITRVSGPATTGNSELAQAQSILAGLVAQHPILKGTTVEFGDARGYQAIAYYQSGRIVISPTHTASLNTILNHEIWHIIDWRDNGRIDWGENVPPR